MLNEFYRSRADSTYDVLFKRYTKFDVLILDDFGLKSLSAEQSSDLYDLIAAVHIKASLIVTTNRKIEKWADIFFDPVMANAALDRIVNNAYRLVLEGDSYRKNFLRTTQKFIQQLRIQKSCFQSYPRKACIPQMLCARHTRPLK